MPNQIQHGNPFTSAGTTVASGSAVASQTATSDRTYYVTDVAVSSNNSTAIAELLGNIAAGSQNADEGDVFWSVEVGNAAPYAQHFEQPIRITTGSAAVLKCGTSTTARVNMAGYFLP